jgi:hypothetical protein
MDQENHWESFAGSPLPRRLHKGGTIFLVLLLSCLAAASDLSVAKIDGLRLRFAAPSGIALEKTSGSAWCLSPDCSVLVTNHHVAAGFGQRTRVKGVGIARKTSATSSADVDATTLKIWSGTIDLTRVRDLALLEMRRPLAGKGMHRTPVFGGRLKLGEKIAAVSYPRGRFQVVTGEFTAEFSDGTLLFTLREPLEMGSSGGLIRNADQQAVATVAFVAEKDHRLVVGIPMWSLADFVRKAKPSLASLFPGDMYRPSEMAEGLPEPIQIDESVRKQLDMTGRNPELPVSPATRLVWPVSPGEIPLLPRTAEVEALRSRVEAMAGAMKNFVALQSLTMQGGKKIWEHDIQVVGGRERFRSPQGEVTDQMPLPSRRGVVPGQEWYGLLVSLMDAKLHIRYAGRTTLGDRPVERFEYSANADESLCHPRVYASGIAQLWDGNASCFGEVLASISDFRVLRVTLEMRMPPASGLLNTRLTMVYGQLPIGTVPAQEFLQATLRSGQLLYSEANFVNYRLFQAKSTIRSGDTTE